MKIKVFWKAHQDGLLTRELAKISTTPGGRMKLLLFDSEIAITLLGGEKKRKLWLIIYLRTGEGK